MAIKVGNLSDLMKSMAGGATSDEGDQPHSIEKWIEERIEHHKGKAALYEKALAEVREFDSRRWDRIYKYTQGEDPDAPVEKVGIHGPGCECPTDDDPEPKVN